MPKHTIKAFSPADIITTVRILCSIALLFCPPLSHPFFVLYIAAGFTDMIDGAVARKTGTAGEPGAKLDTAADFVFAAVCLVKLLPALNIPVWLYIWTGIIALIKVINVVSGFVTQGEFVPVHSIMNKAAGLMLFILPLTLRLIDLKYSAVVVCTAATFAAVQEGHYIRTGKCAGRI